MTAIGPFPSRDAIRASQLPALAHLLRTVAAGNPFYGPILREAGLAEGVPDLETFFRNMPFTRKQAIVDDHHAHPPYGTNLTFPLSAYTRYNQTSATQGAPLRWLDTPESWQWMLDNWKQVYAAAGVTAADCLYFAFSFGPFLGFWTAFEAGCQLGCRTIPGGGLSSVARLHAIRDNRATVLFCTPTYALHLTEVAATEGLGVNALDIRTIIVAGEPGGSVPAVREKLEVAWPKATVFDHHGMTEIGPVSYQCPERPCTLMVIESSYIAEIIDPRTGQPAVRGATGELVLTSLGRIGSPLIRYRTGDLVREDLDVSRCFNRHELALRGGILGRSDDMVLVRGVNVYPAAVEELLRSLPEVVEYQVELQTVHAMTELVLRIEAREDCPEPEQLAERVQSRFRSAFNLRVPVTLCPTGTLPRCEMKSRRWVRGQTSACG